MIILTSVHLKIEGDFLMIGNVSDCFSLNVVDS